MLILTEKPSVAKDFAAALGCSYRGGFYTDGRTVITNCVGHLFRLQEPEFYDPKFKSWNEIPIIPDEFKYTENEKALKQARLVVSLLKKHRFDSIMVATDADREGEIIARECLMESGITDFSRIKRFWVSQALTPEVIKTGMRDARPISEYDSLAENGFGRQHSDWLTGYNFTRYISNAAGRKLSIGRVQTAVLSAIDERCSQIADFKSEKYFEHYVDFEPKEGQRCTVRGIYFENDGQTAFSDSSREPVLRKDIGRTAFVLENKAEKREILAPQLYNLNAVQKDAFKLYGYSPEKTLDIVQKLYEEYKCVSYPRTPSRVMGTKNAELCKKIYNDLAQGIRVKMLAISDISLSNQRVFDDAKLEAHHALIPLKDIQSSANEAEKRIYDLILNRFMIAFMPPFVYNKQTFVLSVNNHKYKIVGREILDSGWKKFDMADRDSNEKAQEENEQDLSDVDWSNLQVSDIETKEKWTKPPKHFNEASVLAFMENPKSEDENAGKLVGLGTQATRHTFIPILKNRGYIDIQKKNIVVTPLGKTVLDAVRKSPLKSIADVSETTNWERQLEENPAEFERKTKDFVKDSVSKKIEINIPPDKTQILCPKCKKPIRRGNKNWYCAGYKDGCDFKIWETISGGKLTENDVSALCSGKKTASKKFTSKGGKEFKAKLFMNENFEVKFDFN